MKLEIRQSAVEWTVDSGAEAQGSITVEIPGRGIKASLHGNGSPIEMQGQAIPGLHGSNVMPSGGKGVIP